MIEIYKKENYFLNMTPGIFGVMHEGGEKPSVLFASGDLGAANAVGPVANILQDQANIVYLAGKSSLQAIEKLEIPKLKPSSVSKEFHPDLIVTGISQSGPTAERFLTHWAKRRNKIPVMWILDSPGGIAAGHLQKLYGLGSFPDYVCVTDHGVKNFVIKSLLQINPEKILVTGQPAFDSVYDLSLRQEQLNSHIRQALEIGPDEKVVLFAGQTDGTKETLDQLIKAMNKLPNRPVLIPRFHPTRDKSLADYPQILAGYRGRVIADTSQFKSTEELASVANLVTSMFSTLNMTAIYLRKPVAYLLFDPGSRGSCLDSYQINPEELPMITLGTASGIFSPENLSGEIKFLLNDKHTQSVMLERQKQFYPNDGKSAWRIANLILSLITIPKPRLS